MEQIKQMMQDHKVPKNTMPKAEFGAWLLVEISPGAAPVDPQILDRINADQSFIAQYLVKLSSSFIDILVCIIKQDFMAIYCDHNIEAQ